MSRLEHLTDGFGNDIYFGTGYSGQDRVRFVPATHIPDFTQQLQDIKNMQLRSDDVLVVGYPKTGNNWTHHMVAMLMEGTTELPPVLRKDDFVFLDGCGGGKQLPPPDKPRTLWSHSPFRVLPRDVTEKKVKVVYITRNLKDVMVSMYCFLQNFGPPLGYTGTWIQFFPFMLENGWWYGNMFDYVLHWEQEITSHPDLPVLNVCFEDTELDPLGQVEKLNQFLGTNRDKEFCQKVVDACSFKNIRRSRQLDQTLMKDGCNWKGDDSHDALYRKGKVGDWKNWFTVAQNEQFDKVYKDKMAGSKMTFVYE